MITTPRAALALALLAACAPSTALPEGGEMRKQHITIPLAGGLATGQDGKQLPIGKSEELQNVRPGRLGEVIQRPGTRALGTSFIGAGGSLPRSWALGTLRGDLVSFSGVGDNPANLYVPTANAWTTDTVSGPSAIRTKRRGPIVATLQQTSGNGQFPDAVYSGGYHWKIYKAFRNGIESVILAVIESATGQTVGEFVRAGAFISWGVRVVNGSAVFVYATTAAVNIDTWPVASIGSGPTNRVAIAKTVANSGRQFDMYVKDATTISAAYSDGTDVQCFDYAPTAGAATFWTPKDAAAANIGVDNGIAWMQDIGNSGKIALIATRAAGGGLRVHWDIPTAGATRQAATTYTMDAGATGGAIAGFTMTSAATGQFTVLYDQNAIGTTSIIKAATREAGVIGTAVYYRSLAMNSKPFQGPDGKYYLGAEFISTTQPTRYVVRVPETRTSFANLTGVVAKSQVNNGYVNGVPSGPLCPVANPVTNEYVYANTVQLRLPGNPTAYVPQGVGIDLVHVKFLPVGDVAVGVPKEAIDSLFTPGGTVGQFDGRNYVEAGFPYYPEQPVVVASGAGRVNSAGTYYYVLTYVGFDSNGRAWESSPSRQVAAVTLANTSADVACPTLRLADRDDVSIRVYRGAINDNVTLALIGTKINDPTVDTVTFVDSFADTLVASGTALYTNGATGNKPLAADGIPGFLGLAIAGNRAWGISADNPFEVWPSNKFIPGQGWRFSEQNKLILNDNLGPVSGIAALPNGVVVIFKETAYYLVSGDGPNQAGNGGSFTISAPAVGVGTVNPRSILETPSGIEFRGGGTTRAWYRVNTALQAEYIGSPAERYSQISGTAVPMVGAVLVTLTGETRYYTQFSDAQDITTLVHDPISDTWMVDASADDYGNNLTACAYNGGAAVAKDNAIWVDDASTARDGAAGYTVRTVTPWIKGGDLDGYATFIRVRGVGETLPGSPTITIALQADFDETTNVTSQTVSPGALWDWELKYPAKLSAFRFVISYQTNAVPVKMSALVVEYGVKTGMAPVSYTKRSQ